MTNRSIEVEATLRLAFEALEHMCHHTRAKVGYKGKIVEVAMSAIKDALEAHKALMSFQDGAQPAVASEQKPVAITITGKLGNIDSFTGDYSFKKGDKVYTTPPPVAEPHKRKPLTDAQLEKGRDQTFSINNPFCPCDSKTFRKVARWVEAAHDIKE